MGHDGGMLRFAILLPALWLALAPAGARAADVAPLAAPAPAENGELKNCAFITNDCEVCTVEPDGRVSCTSQGIACTVTRRWCLIPGK
jgi:hypothetical protein